MSTLITATTSTANRPPAETEEVAATPTPALQSSKSLPASFPPRVTPNNQQASSNNFTFPSSGDVTPNNQQASSSNFIVPPPGENTLNERIEFITNSVGVVLTKYEDEKGKLKAEKKQLSDYVDARDEKIENLEALFRPFDFTPTGTLVPPGGGGGGNIREHMTNLFDIEDARHENDKKKLRAVLYSRDNKVEDLNKVIEQVVEQANAYKENAINEKNVSDGKYSDLVQEAAECSTQLRFAQQNVLEKETANQNLRTNNVELHGKISLVQNTVVTLEGKLAKLRDINTNVCAEKEKLTSENALLEVELKSKEKSHSTALASKEMELASKDETIKNVCAEKEELTSKNSQLQDELKSTEESHNTALALKDEELASKDVELTTKDKELAQLHAEVEQLRTDKLEAEVTRRKEELDRRLARKREELARKREKLDGDQEELDRRKETFLIKYGDNDNEEDVMKTAPTPSAANISSDDDNEVEVEIVGSTGDNANSDYPHARCDCTVHHFDNTNVGSIRHPSSSLAKKNEHYCQKCYCFVCDTLASECKEWCGTAGHCNATSTSKKWREIRVKKREAKAAM